MTCDDQVFRGKQTPGLVEDDIPGDSSLVVDDPQARWSSLDADTRNREHRDVCRKPFEDKPMFSIVAKLHLFAATHEVVD